jgi:hypothetical protein
VEPPPQVVPQVPQLFESEPRSTQAPPQAERPMLQFAWHLPEEHTSFAPHAVPQAPQFLGSVVSSTHVPLHDVWPAGHAQVLFAHCLPPVHVTPHEPQFAESVFVSTQAPLHDV